MKIILLESAGWRRLTGIDRGEVGRLINDFAQEANELMPDLSGELNVIVKPDLPHVSDIDGVGGSTFDHELVDVTFTTDFPGGLDMFKRYLRETIFHELNHALHTKYHPRESRPLWWVTLEGLGTVFDRDYAGGTHEYVDARWDSSTEMIEWLGQQGEASLRTPNPPADWGDRMYSTGVWLIDRAIDRSGKSVIELTRMSCDEILQLAEEGGK